MTTLNDDGLRCEDRVLDGFVIPRKHEVVNLTQVSPLPVKQFDFSHEGNSICHESSDVCLQQKSGSMVRTEYDQKERQDCEEKPKSDDLCLPSERIAEVAGKGSDLSTN